MVLADLGKRITDSLKGLAGASDIDEKLLDKVLQNICRALLESDVSAKLVFKLRTNIKKIVEDNTVNVKNVNKKSVIERAIFDELCRLVDPHSGKEPWQPRKNRANVVMFVGLQGAGKTTSVTKLASYYARRGFKCAVVAADTYRAGAFDQLKQNATKAKIPFYGSYTEADAAKVARDGVEMFKKESFELIIVDTSGRHKQEAALFTEMLEIRAAVNPDHIIFVLDGTIGQAAELQATAFQEAVDIGSIIITKLDGHAKGGGALSAVAATDSPIIFIGTGEHLHDFEPFRPRAFVQKMLGMGDLGGLLDTIQSSIKVDDQEEIMKNITQGTYSIKDMSKQLEMIQGLGPLGKVISMMPGLPPEMAEVADKHGPGRMKRMMCVLDSMTPRELNSDGKLFLRQPSRVVRVSRGSGVPIPEVEMVLQMYATFANTFKAMGGKNGLFSMMEKAQSAQQKGGKVAVTPQQMAKMNQQMNQLVPPNLMQQMGGLGGMGGMGNLQSMMQSMGLGGGPSGAGPASSRRSSRTGGPSSQQGMPQLPGNGQMPDLSALMKMMGNAFGGGGN